MILMSHFASLYVFLKKTKITEAIAMTRIHLHAELYHVVADAI